MGTPAEEFGPYVVHEQLGLGGMATVHRAETQGIEGFSKQVALKRMLPNVSSDASLVKSFIREARLASHLRHANVAQTYDLGKVGETYFIAMELVPGRNLREVLKHCAAIVGHMPLGIALNIVTQICDALDYAHELCDETGQPLGIIHRDVSPSNIIVSEGGTVKLIDFGIAKASGRSGMNTMSGMIKGKFGYMAPEYLMGSIDTRADLFALGVIAHELLANRPLFQGKDDMDTLYRVKDMPILPPSRINPQVPPELDAVVMTALERNPDQRWQRANALRQALNTEIKRLNLVAQNREVIEWVDWAFAQSKSKTSQFDVDSEPMISISSGTSQMPQPKHVQMMARRGSSPAREREVPDDFANSDGMATLVHSAGTKQKPDDWNSTDTTAPGSDALDRPIGGMDRDHGEWKGNTDVPTTIERKSAPVAAQPDPRREGAGRPSSPHAVARPTPVPTRNTPQASASMTARAIAQHADQERTLRDPVDQARFGKLEEDEIITDDRPGAVPKSNAQARTIMIEPARVAPIMPYTPPARVTPSTPYAAPTVPAPPARVTPSTPYAAPAAAPAPSTPPHARTLPGAGGPNATPTPTPQALAAAAAGYVDPATSGARTTPRMVAAGQRIDNLSARGERPSANNFAPAAPTGHSAVQTKVEPGGLRGASNFLLALLVLIAAGGAAAVVYFALPYLT